MLQALLIPSRRRSQALLAVLTAVLAMLVPAAADAKVPKGFFGISAQLPDQRDFEGMQQAGLGTYRFGASWRGVQSTRKGPYTWGGFDASVREAANHGMQPVPVLFGTPRFVHKAQGKIYPPTSSEDLKQWHRFVAAAARRYGPGGEFWAQNPLVRRIPIRSWIIWNEQNAKPYWNPRPDPRQYARLVEVSDDALAGVDPGARIILGGIFGYPQASSSISASRFLTKLYRVDGIKRHFEAINLHPYGSGVATVRKQVSQARSALRKAKDSRAEIVIGEMGWASSGPARSPSVVGRRGQARRIREGLNLLIRNRDRWNISGVYVYLWRDFSGETSCLWCPRAGLVTKRHRAKPALRALKRVIRANR